MSHSAMVRPARRRGQHVAVWADRRGVQRVFARGGDGGAGQDRVTRTGQAPQPQRPVGPGRGQQVAGRVQADRLDHALAVGQPRGGRRAGGVEQAGQGIGGPGDAVGGHAQLGGQRGVLAAQLAGLHRQLPGIGVVAGGGRARALLEGVAGQHQHRHHRGRQRDDQPLEPDRAVTLGALAGSFLGHRRGHELAGQRAQRIAVVLVGGPVPDDGQLAAAGERRAVPARLVPGPGGLGDPPPGPQVVGVLLDPGPQPRPGHQQRVMGDLRGPGAGRDQPLADEPAEQPGDVAAAEFGLRHDAAGRRRVVGHMDQAKEQSPRLPLLIGGQAPEHVLGGPADGVRDPAAGPVVGDRDGGGAAVLPGAEQGM